MHIKKKQLEVIQNEKKKLTENKARGERPGDTQHTNNRAKRKMKYNEKMHLLILLLILSKD